MPVQEGVINDPGSIYDRQLRRAAGPIRPDEERIFSALTNGSAIKNMLFSSFMGSGSELDELALNFHIRITFEIKYSIVFVESLIVFRLGIMELG